MGNLFQLDRSDLRRFKVEPFQVWGGVGSTLDGRARSLRRRSALAETAQRDCWGAAHLRDGVRWVLSLDFRKIPVQLQAGFPPERLFPITFFCIFQQFLLKFEQVSNLRDEFRSGVSSTFGTFLFNFERDSHRRHYSRSGVFLDFRKKMNRAPNWVIVFDQICF